MAAFDCVPGMHAAQDACSNNDDSHGEQTWSGRCMAGKRVVTALLTLDQTGYRSVTFWGLRRCDPGSGLGPRRGALRPGPEPPFPEAPAHGCAVHRTSGHPDLTARHTIHRRTGRSPRIRAGRSIPPRLAVRDSVPSRGTLSISSGLYGRESPHMSLIPGNDSITGLELAVEDGEDLRPSRDGNPDSRPPQRPLRLRRLRRIRHSKRQTASAGPSTGSTHHSSGLCDARSAHKGELS